MSQDQTDPTQYERWPIKQQNQQLPAVFIREQNGSSLESVRTFYVAPDMTSAARQKSLRHRHPFTHRLQTIFRELFLPQGYPDSVSSDYMEYQVYDTLQAFASSIVGTLATRSVLEGVGVGDETATVMGATMTWLLKDGSGMIGRIVFAWLRGTQLDADSKRWRLAADILNDVAFTVDLLVPYFPRTLSTPLFCVSAVFRSIVGVAGGATRAALTQHQARRNNLADVSAKDGSQETMVNLAALLCSLLLVPLVADDRWMLWMCFVVLTCLHLYANYKAVKSLCMETLNLQRYRLLLNNHFNGRALPSVRQANLLEPLFFLNKPPAPIHLCRSLDRFYSDCGEHVSNLNNLIVQPKRNYAIGLSLYRGQVEVDVFLARDAAVTDMLRAVYEAQLAAHLHTGNNRTSSITTLLDRAHSQTREEFPMFHDRLRSAGWNVDYCLLGFEEWRIVNVDIIHT